MKIKISKKANSLAYVIGILLAIMTFFIYLTFFTGIKTSIATSSDDLYCRVFVAAKDTKIVKTGEFFHEMRQRCKLNEPVKFNFDEKEESYDDLINGMSRCWYRYGEGEFDFMSNLDTNGNWCYLCGEVQLNDVSQSLAYKDFIDYAKTKKYNESMTYAQYINLKYVSTNDDEIKGLRKDYEVLISDKDIDASVKSMIILLGEQINLIDDMRTKQINGADEKMYMVYRYDRIPKDFTEKINDAESGAKIGIGVGLVTAMVVEGITEAVVVGGIGATVGGTAGLGVGAIPGTIIGGLFGFVKGVFKPLYKGVNDIMKISRITNVIKRAARVIKNTKTIKNVDNVEDVVEISVKGKNIKLFSKVTGYEASPDDIMKFASAIKKQDPIVAKHFEGLAKMMDDIGVKSFKEIDNKIFSLEKNIGKNDVFLDDFLKKTDAEKIDLLFAKKYANADDLVGNNLDDIIQDAIIKKDIDTAMAIENLRDLKFAAKNEVELLKSGAKVEDPVGIRNYLRIFYLVGSGLVGGAISSSTNTNYNQYVDLLTREQYYRLCGTQRFD